MSRGAFSESRGQLLLGLVAGALLALVGRLCHIHAVLSREDGQLAQHMRRQQRATIPIPARRGEIRDVANRVLAGSHECPSIFADPSLIQDPGRVGKLVGSVIGMQPEALEKLLRDAASEGRQFVWLSRRTHPSREKAIDELDLAGIGVIYEPRRYYPMGTVGAHVVGFVNIDEEGLEGIERQYDRILKGVPGSRTIYRDAGYRPIGPAEGEDTYIAPRDGMSVKLTIDAVVQEILDDQVAAAVKQFKAASGVGIIMNPRTGDVLAMTSYPGYDPNDPGSATDDARRNRVLRDPCEPGSTFKPFAASAALAEGVVRRGEIINCHGGLYAVGSRRLHDHHPYGDLTFEQIVAKSSNIGMALLGERLGNERLHRYLRAFGFGARTGIELPREDVGILLPLRQWTSFSTTSLPMGQEVAVTPLQLATAFCAIVNGGKLVRPRVVRAIVDPCGEVVEEFTQPQVVRQVIPPDVAEYMTKTVLVAVVNEGTGTKAQLDEYQVLGKTGTAQIARKGGGGFEPGKYTSSFIGAAPASNPAVVVLIMIREPRGVGYYGGTVAAPPVREVLRRTLAYLQVPPDKVADEAWRAGAIGSRATARR